MSRSDCTFGTFGDFIDAHHVEILRYLVRLTGNDADAEDLFQNTFLRAFTAFSRLRPASNRLAWIYRIATNTFLNHRRAARRRNEAAMPHDLAGPGASPTAAHDVASTAVVFRRAVAELPPPRQRAAFVQRNLQRLSYEHVAAALWCSPAAARANVYQAIRRLRRELANRRVRP